MWLHQIECVSTNLLTGLTRNLKFHLKTLTRMKSMCKILIITNKFNVYFHMNLWYKTQQHFLFFYFWHKLKIQLLREPKIQPTEPKQRRSSGSKALSVQHRLNKKKPKYNHVSKWWLAKDCNSIQVHVKFLHTLTKFVLKFLFLSSISKCY